MSSTQVIKILTADQVDASAISYLPSYPRGGAHLNITNTCDRPWNTVIIHPDGECYTCICGAWLPISVGNIQSFDKIEDIWNNPTANFLQQDLIDKKFTYCAVNHCGITDHNIIDQPQKYTINLSVDESCNLACPSCRRTAINITSGPLFDTKSIMISHLLELIQNCKNPMELIMISSGDPLASLIMRPLILNWQPTINQTITLFTNGLLMKKLLPSSSILSNITKFWISVDAGSKEVYENVRRPGKFEILRENLDWLSKNKPKFSEVTLKFTLSASNANDIINFCDMVSHYNFIGDISNVDDLRTWDDFSSHEVISNTAHPYHSTAITQLRNASTRPYIGLSSFFNKVL